MNKIFLNDNNMSYEEAQVYFKNASEWAEKHCTSFIGYNVQDVSDVSYSNDLIALYIFNNPKDATCFTLKWA